MPVDGAYQLASYFYTVYARQYANALVLYKPVSEWNYSPGITAASATIASAGSGYTNDDIVTVQGGTYAYGAQAQFELTVSAGVVTAATLYNGRAGNYSVFPTGPVSVTGGTGSGLTLDLAQTPGSLSSATTFNLPPSPTGNWYFLNADYSGTVSDTTPLTQITLDDGEGAILVTKPSSGPPVLANIEGPPLSFVQGQAPQQVTANITATDSESATIVGVRVAIAANYQPNEDVLSFAGTSNITGSWNAATGILTLGGSDTLADYQAALRSVNYVDTSPSPSSTVRIVSFQVNDGMAESNVLTRQITVDPAIAIGPASLPAGAVDATYDQTVTASGGTGNVTLAVSKIQGTIPGLVVPVAGSDSLAIGGTPTETGAESFTVTATDSLGASTSANYTVAVNNPPVLARIESTALSYTQGNSATTVTAAIAVSDPESTTLIGAAVWIGGAYQSGEDLLSFTNTANITGSWNAAAGVLTLTGSDTLADYQAALQAVTYFDASFAPTSGTRIVSFQVNDGQAESNVATRQVIVTPLVESPVDVVRIVDDATVPGDVDVFINNSSPSPTYRAALAGIPQWEFSGSAGSNQLVVDFSQGIPLPAGGLVYDGGNLASGNSLSIVGISGNATIAQSGSEVTVNGSPPISYSNVTYFGFGTQVAAGGSGSGTVIAEGTLQVNGSGGLPSEESLTIGPGAALMYTNGATQPMNGPVLANVEGSSLAYVQGELLSQVTASLAVSDVKSATIESATVAITGNYLPNQDVLSYANTANITGSWNSAAGVLTLTGSDTLADYQAALQAVTYFDTSFDPTSGTRTVSFQVDDGQAESNVATRQVLVTPVVESPVDAVRIVDDATVPGNVDVFINNSGPIPTYTAALARIPQWEFSGAAGSSQLIVDFSQGDPLPAGGLVYDGGNPATGNSLSIVGISGNASIAQSESELTVSGSPPISYSNVTCFGFGTQVAAGSGSSTVIAEGMLQVSGSGGLPSGESLSIDPGATFVFTSGATQLIATGSPIASDSLGLATWPSFVSLACARVRRTSVQLQYQRRFQARTGQLCTFSRGWRRMLRKRRLQSVWTTSLRSKRARRQPTMLCCKRAIRKDPGKKLLGSGSLISSFLKIEPPALSVRRSVPCRSCSPHGANRSHKSGLIKPRSGP